MRSKDKVATTRFVAEGSFVVVNGRDAGRRERLGCEMDLATRCA
jgi:hypothetical protein